MQQLILQKTTSRFRYQPLLPGWRSIAVWMCCLFNECPAQDPHFSQFYAAPLHLNPALMGAEKDISFGLNHRTQWRILGFPQYTSQFSVILPATASNHKKPSPYAWGFTAHNDVAGQGGSLTATGANLSFSYNFPLASLASQMITVSGQAGIVQKRISLADLQWGSQFDPSIGYNPDLLATYGENSLNTIFPVFNTGAVWFFNPRKNWRLSEFSAYAGVAAANLNQPNEAILTSSPHRLPIILKLHGGVEWKVSPQVYFSPAFLWMQQTGNQQINLGGYVTYQILGQSGNKKDFTRLSVGSWYRFNDSFIASLGVTRLRYTVGFSYDVNVSTLRQYTYGQGALEISMSYRLIKNSGNHRFSIPMM